MTLCIKRKMKLQSLPAYTALAFAAALASMPTVAMELDSGNPDMTLRWDNTVKYSAAKRTKDASPTLSTLPSAFNVEAGDANFPKSGQISNRFDLLTELEGKSDNYGFRISAAAWNDSNYLNSKFSQYTQDTHGRKQELKDAFVSTRFNLGEHSTTVRLGQHSVQWGESIFFGDNGIGGVMSPIDTAKALSVPNLRFQEILRPVPQVSGQFQVDEAMSIYSFYQPKWVESREQGYDSYFAPFNMLSGGPTKLIPIPVAPYAYPISRLATQDAKNSGQWGLSLKLSSEETDYGFYYVRSNSKEAQSVTSLGPLPGNQFGPTAFYSKYHSGVTTVGASANRSIGKFNYGIEASVRDNQDLLSVNAYDAGAGAKYATGKTFHLNVNAFGTSMGRTALWSDAILIGEFAFNRVLSVKENADTLSGNQTRDTKRVQVLFEPVWYQAFDGVDIRMPVGYNYSLKGSRNVVGPAPMPDGGGAINIGLSGSYMDVWRFGVNKTHYTGKSKPLAGANETVENAAQFNYGQYFKDRDYVSVYATRTF